MSKRTAQLEADIVSYVDTVESLEADIVAERAKALEALAEVERLQAALKEAETERDEAYRDANAAEARISEVEAERDALADERDSLQEDLKYANERLEAVNGGDAEVEDALLDLCASLGYGPNPLRVDSRELQRLLDLLH